MRTLVARFVAVALLLGACDFGSELVTTTPAPTTTVVLAPAARARATVCEPLTQFLDLNPIVGFPIRVERAVQEARRLLDAMAAVTPGAIADEYRSWVEVRRAALDAIEEAGFNTSEIAPDDPRFAAVAAETTREMESLLLTYCTAEVVLPTHPWLDEIEPLLIPPERALDERLDNGVVLRSLAEIGSVTRPYVDLFGAATAVDGGLEWRGSYANVPYVVFVRYDGLGSLVRITHGEPEG